MKTIYETCPDCEGEGWVLEHDCTEDGQPILVKSRCQNCEGEGEIESEVMSRYDARWANADDIRDERRLHND